RHKFAFNVVYNTHYGNKDNGFAYHLLNNWTISPIFNWFSGQRYTGTITNSIVPASFGFTTCTSGGVTSPCAPPGGGPNGSGGSTRFALAPRNFFKQPSIQYLDLRLSRRFPI